MSKLRIISCTPELFVDLCKPCDKPFTLQVMDNALPSDTKYVRCFTDDTREPTVVKCVIESEEFDEVAPGHFIPEHPPVVFQRNLIDPTD